MRNDDAPADEADREGFFGTRKRDPVAPSMPDLNATTALQCATTLLLHAPCFLSTNQSHGVLFRWNDPETIGIDARPLPNEDDRVLATFCSKSHCPDAGKHAPDDRQFEIQRDALTLPSVIRIKLPECSCRDEGFVFFGPPPSTHRETEPPWHGAGRRSWASLIRCTVHSPGFTVPRCGWPCGRRSPPITPSSCAAPKPPAAPTTHAERKPPGFFCGGLVSSNRREHCRDPFGTIRASVRMAPGKSERTVNRTRFSTNTAVAQNAHRSNHTATDVDRTAPRAVRRSSPNGTRTRSWIRT